MFSRAFTRGRFAFTLIELLVVIAIVAVLLSLLLPALAAARESGRATTCLCNLQQLGMSVKMYGDANEEAVVALTETDTGFVHWIELLQPYIADGAICRCRSDASRRWEPDPFAIVYGRRTTSYVTNDRMTPALGIFKLAQVRDPSSRIFFGEFKDDQVGDHFHPQDWPLYLSTPQDELAIIRHRNRANYWFVDGHVERLRFANTWNIDGSVDWYDPVR